MQVSSQECPMNCCFHAVWSKGKSSVLRTLQRVSQRSKVASISFLSSILFIHFNGSLPIDRGCIDHKRSLLPNCYQPCKTLPSMLKSVHPFVTFPHCLACILQLPGVGPSGLWLSLDLPSLQFIQGQVLVVPPLQSFPLDPSS